MIISLVGYMGSGKSHVSKVLSNQLNLKLIDLDKEISTQIGLSIPEIFQEKGEIYFRKKEKETLDEILSTEKHAILSVGGGTPAYYNNMEMITKNTESVYLRTSIKDLMDRLSKNKEKRPLIARIDDEDLPEFIAKHLFERQPFYSQAKYTISTDDKNVQNIVDEIIMLLHFPPPSH